MSSAAILRSLPDRHPSLRMTGNLDLSGATIVSSVRFSARALRSTGSDGVNDHLITKATISSYDDDILLVDGHFTREPLAM